jgi:hypothetical protein
MEGPKTIQEMGTLTTILEFNVTILFYIFWGVVPIPKTRVSKIT